ncbi:MAG: hypothetical protein M3307_01165 [Thermoproteota archaeon]|nr:hypothetical protein [Thermoproteota archaeon]
MAAQLEKVFQCLTCKQDIKLARKDDNSGWIRYNLDGTLHIDKRKKKLQQQQPQPTTTTGVTVDNGPQIAELAKQVSELRETVNVLISQIQFLRSEVESKK